MEKRFFFIINMPRARSAWCSQLLSQGDSFCAHEGIKGFGDFADYAKWLHDMPETAVGDADSQLVYFIPELLEWFPGATFVFVDRDRGEALESLCKAYPDLEQFTRERWPGYLEAYEKAKADLSLAGAAVSFVDVKALGLASWCAEIYRRCTGADVSPEKLLQLLKLRVTSLDGSAAVVPTPARKAVPLEHSEVLEKFQLDTTGLTVSQYDVADMEFVQRWWAVHTLKRPFSAATLPPLGVVVHDEEGPAGVLWCYEFYGTGVAMLEWPCTRPGMNPEQVRRVMSFAVAACISMAGKLVTPPAEYRVFRVATLPGIARFLKRLGFVEDGGRVAMTLDLTIKSD